MNKVLVVDDDERILQGFSRALHGVLTIDTACDANVALDKVAKYGPYSVILTDMMMPGIDGVELLKKLEVVAPDTVKIMLTGSSSQKIAMDAINLGKIYKFLLKPIDGSELKSVIESGIDLYNKKMCTKNENSHRDIEVMELTSKLNFYHSHDKLTGLLNRSTFIKEVGKTLDLQTHCSVCYLDIDHFLVVNESVGATAGDELLKQISHILLNCTPIGTILARLGGDGFGVLLGEPITEVEPLIEKIKAAINAHVFIWRTNAIRISASFGLISVENNNHDANTLLNLAENSCCLAKESGRNRIHFANMSDNLLSNKMTEIHWVNRLSSDEGMNQLVLYKQEITSLSPLDSSNKHYEILLRYKEINGDIVLPGEFLGAAEHYQISPKIDRWVILNCARLLSQSPQNINGLSLCSINLSGHSINEPGMADFIIDIFSKFKIPPEKICFELTETAAIGYFPSAIEFISCLKKQGFIFALDDFGTGLSSYEYLKSLPVDILKIDGSFVKKMDKDLIDLALTKSMCEVGKAMGLKIVAECVENESVLQLLEGLGIDYVQGFYLDKPSIFVP